MEIHDFRVETRCFHMDVFAVKTDAAGLGCEQGESEQSRAAAAASFHGQQWPGLVCPGEATGGE